MQPVPQSIASQNNTRNPLFRPFAFNSIWNYPIGDEARYVPTNIQPAYLSTDTDHFFVTTESDPKRNLFRVGGWRNRSTGTADLGIDVALPDALIIPDTNEVETPNNSAAFLLPDGNTLLQLNATTRDRVGGNLYGVKYPFGPYQEERLRGDGTLGGHGGSGLSSIGGTIRIGELTGNKPIQHALKLNLWAEKYFSYAQGSGGGRGYRWPAIKADDYANAQTYGGERSELLLGSLLAIPPRISPESLGLRTKPAKKIFYALQNYGGYVVDDTAWDSHAVAVESGVHQEFEYAYGYSFKGDSGRFYNDMMAIFEALHVVNNNLPNRIGGGGDPLVAFAPPIDTRYVNELQSLLADPTVEDTFKADFNGDGKRDLLWRNLATGSMQVWLRDGQGRIIGGGNILPVANWDWQIEDVSDIDGDGRAEILWGDRATGAEAIWHLDDVRRWRNPSNGKRVARWIDSAAGAPRIESLSSPNIGNGNQGGQDINVVPSPGQYRRYEAESLNLENYKVVDSPASGASNNQYVTLSRTVKTGTLSGTFDGPAGQYQVKLLYFDESDGVANLKVTVAGNTQSFLLNQSLQQNFPGPLALTKRVTHNSIALQPGVPFTIEGQIGGGEFARVDAIAFIPLNGENNPSRAALPTNTISVVPSSSPTSRATFVDDVLSLTNRFRTRNGVAPLDLDVRLNRAAQTHANNMAQDDFFSHVGVDNSTPLQRAEAEGYDAFAIAENIGGRYDSPESVFESWKQSPSSRETLLNPKADSIGIGYASNSLDLGQVGLNHYWTQLIGVDA